jgi:hypothetical protein
MKNCPDFPPGQNAFKLTLVRTASEGVPRPGFGELAGLPQRRVGVILGWESGEPREAIIRNADEPRSAQKSYIKAITGQ